MIAAAPRICGTVALVVSGEQVTRAKFPFIDVHGHQDGRQSAESLATLIGEMDEINLAVMVNLSGDRHERRRCGHDGRGALPLPARG